MLIDTHCHLADQAFAADLDEVVLRARKAGLSAAMCILSADEADEVARASIVARAWPDVRFAAGIHPHRAGQFAGRPSDAAMVVRNAVAASSAVAIGEIGLDYHYEHAPREVQREIFALQIDAAIEQQLPVVIHTREAADDTAAVLRAAGPAARGVMHCFTGTLDEARHALDLGFYISMSGILTFPRSAQLRDVAAFVPIDRLFIETDAPFLAPVPHRGTRNEPAWVAETFRVLAGIRSVDEETLQAQLAANVAALIPELGHARAR